MTTMRDTARGLAVALSLMAGTAGADEIETSAGTVEITPVMTGLTEPWAVGFLPGGGILVTERAGRLQHARPGAGVVSVSGLPRVAATGQGGLLDIMVPRDFESTREIFLSFATPQDGGGAGTALGVGRLSDDGSRLEGFRTVFEMTPGSRGGRHFGSRIVEAADGTLFLTMGDRGDRPSAQDLSRHNGSVVRLDRDGSVPEDNPFVGQSGARPEIWSYGHRNPQGAALDGDGQLWVTEHGARGGDEVNRVARGANYGWPVIAYGRHYSGGQIGEGQRKEGMEQPAHYWDPSIAPSGHVVYSGALWPEWEGDHFVGSLKFDYIARLDPDRDWAEEAMEAPETARVRDIAEGPDGALWFLSVGEGALYRMRPAIGG